MSQFPSSALTIRMPPAGCRCLDLPRPHVFPVCRLKRHLPDCVHLCLVRPAIYLWFQVACSATRDRTFFKSSLRPVLQSLDSVSACPLLCPLTSGCLSLVGQDSHSQIVYREQITVIFRFFSPHELFWNPKQRVP